MPPEPLKHLDALTEDQQRELSNEIRKTMIDAHMSHFAIEEQPFRKFVFADEIKIDSLTENDVCDVVLRDFKSIYFLTETFAEALKRLISPKEKKGTF